MKENKSKADVTSACRARRVTRLQKILSPLTPMEKNTVFINTERCERAYKTRFHSFIHISLLFLSTTLIYH